MENKENTNPQFIKVKETLTKELESLSAEELHEFFKFFYKMNHNQSNMISVDKFEEFLEAFDSNPFKISEDKKFKQQLIDNIIYYSFDHMREVLSARGTSTLSLKLNKKSWTHHKRIFACDVSNLFFITFLKFSRYTEFRML